MVKRILGMKVVVLTLVLIGYCSVYASEQKYKSATITDIDGKSYTVTNLLAKYSAGGSWLGGPPTISKEILTIEYAKAEGRATIYEKSDYPFASMRRIVFKDVDIPETYKESFKDGNSSIIRIDLKNGCSMLIGNKLLIEIDVKGNQTKSIIINDYDFKCGEQQGQSITLDGFKGNRKSSANKMSDFWISYGDVKSIEFK